MTFPRAESSGEINKNKFKIDQKKTCITKKYLIDVYKRQGRVLFEIAGVPEETAREALRLAMHKLPCKCKIVSKADLEGGDNSEN